MKLTRMILSATALASAVTIAIPAAAQMPTPTPAEGMRQAQAYLFNAGAGDVFEITTGMMAVQHSANPDVRAFATMLIDHHTRLTNNALTTAKNAGVMAPPPELSRAQKAMVGALIATPPVNFDHVFLTQQIAAHQQALALNQGYASGGDVPALREGARGAVPIIQQHLGQAQQLMTAIHR